MARVVRFWGAVMWGAIALAAVGCRSTLDDGAAPARQTIGPGGSGGGTVGGAGDGEAVGEAGVADAGTDASVAPGTDGPSSAVRDCFPECIAALRRACLRPAPDAGACGAAGNQMGSVYCYSNGIREYRDRVNRDDASITFTLPDGQTPCYHVYVSGAEQTYSAPAGGEVARVVSLGDDHYDVTCDGATVTVDASDPACRTLEERDCTGSQNYCL